MIREQTIRARQKLVSKLPITGELLRGTLLERTVRHTKDCPKCARGEGHHVFVLTVMYPGHRTRQISVRRERVAEVRRWLEQLPATEGRRSRRSANSTMICCARNGLRQSRGDSRMIEMRRRQLSFGDGLIAEEVSDLREDWMTYADEVLADEEIVAIVYAVLAKRRPKSRCRGRRGTPADVVLRLLTLKHIKNWSYEELEREVRANLVYRDFTRVGAGKMPDAKTMGRWGVALGPQVIAQLHARLVAIAKDKGVVEGRKMRVDTTVVETNIHYPTDSSLLGDGVRVLIRTMKKITKIAGDVGTKLRDRSRSVKLRVVEIGAGGALQGQAGPRETQPRLRPIARFDEPRGRTGEALRARHRRRHQVRRYRHPATGA
jgi:hypothetical protein